MLVLVFFEKNQIITLSKCLETTYYQAKNN